MKNFYQKIIIIKFQKNSKIIKVEHNNPVNFWSSIWDFTKTKGKKN